MNAIFGIFTNIIYEYMIFYTSQTSLKTMPKWVKKGQKEVKKGKIKKAHRKTKMPGICENY